MRISWILLVALLGLTGCAAAQGRPSLGDIAEQVDDGNGDAMEPVLLEMHSRNPGNAEVMAQLARIEYLRAVRGLSNRPGTPPDNPDRSALDRAEQWLRKAVEVNSAHANAWVVYGQVQYARSEFSESMRMLERAEAIDPSSVKLRLRKGTTLHALAVYKGDESLRDAAVDEYRRAIDGVVDDGNERLAASEIAGIRAGQGRLKEALNGYTAVLASAQGRERAFVLDRRSHVLLNMGRVDDAIADSRAALDEMDFGVGRSGLALALLVKAGLQVREGKSEEAEPYLLQAFQTGVNPAELLGLLAAHPERFAGLYAVLGPNTPGQGWESRVAAALKYSAAFVKKDDLKRMRELGVSFDARDDFWGTLLQRAVAADNVDGVQALLELGADASIPTPNGMTLLELATVGTSPQRRAVRGLILGKTGKPPGWKDPEVDMPRKGQWYRVDEPIGISGDGAAVLLPGQTVLASDACHLMHVPQLCMVFYDAPGVGMKSVHLPVSDAHRLRGLRKVAPPSRQDAVKSL